MSTLKKTRTLLLANNPYDKSVTWLLHIITLCAVTALGILIVVYIQHYTQPKQVIYGVAPDNSRFKMHSLEEPNVASETLLNWASYAVTSCLTVDFTEEDQSYFTRIRPFFTEDGFNSYRDSIASKSFLADIRAKKLIAQAIIRGRPLIATEGFDRDAYTWIISVPIIVTYTSTAKPRNDKARVALTIKRIPTSESYLGIGIEQMVVRLTDK